MRREDHETATLDAADAFERSFAPTDYEDACERGYDPSDDTIGSRIPLTDPTPFERAVRKARGVTEVRSASLPPGVQVDPEDLARLGSKTLYVGTNGYVYFSTHATGPVTLHSWLMGGSDSQHHIDHINGDRLDNRRANLRRVTPQLNQVNRKALNRNNTSGVRGVQRTGASRLKPWRAQITVGQRGIHLGLFETQDQAIDARKAAERRYYGEECP